MLLKGKFKYKPKGDENVSHVEDREFNIQKGKSNGSLQGVKRTGTHLEF